MLSKSILCLKDFDLFQESDKTWTNFILQLLSNQMT